MPVITLPSELLGSQLFGAFLLPPGGLLLLAFIGELLSWRWLKTGRIITLSALAAIYLLSTPRVADSLMKVLDPPRSASTLDLKSVDAIVVLGGGKAAFAPEYDGVASVRADTLERLRYAARLARETGKPLMVSGGTPDSTAMVDALTHDFGVPVRWVEARSRTTFENARESARLLNADGMHRIALVSQAWHLPRAAPAFAAQGLDIVPAPTGNWGYEARGWLAWLPRSAALNSSSTVLRELAGALWYRVSNRM